MHPGSQHSPCHVTHAGEARIQVRRVINSAAAQNPPVGGKELMAAAVASMSSSTSTHGAIPEREKQVVSSC